MGWHWIFPSFPSGRDIPTIIVKKRVYAETQQESLPAPLSLNSKSKRHTRRTLSAAARVVHIDDEEQNKPPDIVVNEDGEGEYYPPDVAKEVQVSRYYD